MLRRNFILQSLPGANHHVSRMDITESSSSSLEKTIGKNYPCLSSPSETRYKPQSHVARYSRRRRRRGLWSRALETKRLLGHALSVIGILRGCMLCCCSLRTSRRLELLRGPLLLLRQLLHHRFRRFCQHATSQLSIRSFVSSII